MIHKAKIFSSLFLNLIYIGEDFMINEFREENYFLSNFYQGKEFIYKGMKFNNAEAAFKVKRIYLNRKNLN